jgi:acetylornithine deacetylase/succinyl-diaminopimelate desuccinylase-like protein
MPTTGDAQLVKFLRDLVRIDSTPGREEQVVRRIVEEMCRLGYDAAGVDASGNAVGRVGAGSPVVLVDCHVDTIPLHSPELWRHPPLAAEVAGGRIYGLGVCDMKASAAAAVYGVARLLRRRKRLVGTVWVVCSIAEEMMEGAALAATFDSCGPDMAVIGEPSDLRLCIGQRGRAKLEVDVTGVASHAATPLSVSTRPSAWRSTSRRSRSSTIHVIRPWAPDPSPASTSARSPTRACPWCLAAAGRTSTPASGGARPRRRCWP